MTSTIRDSRTVQVRRALARCLREQRRCRRYLRAGGPDAAGAWAGLEDWAMEETYYSTGRAEFGDRTRPVGHDTGEHRARQSYTT